MVKKKFNKSKGKFEDKQPDVNPTEIAEEIYKDVGKRFPITWKNGKPHIETDNLPKDVSLSDIEKSLNKSKIKAKLK